MAAAECVLECADALGECALWCTRTRRLWWVDIRAPSLQSYEPGSGEHGVYRLPGRAAGCFAVRESGGYLLALDNTLVAYDTSTGVQQRIADPEPGKPRNRLNDGRCDRRGRFWVGSMEVAPPGVAPGEHGSLYRVGADRTASRMLSGLQIPNSIAFSPDDRTFYFSDTRKKLIWSFDFDIDTGDIAKRRVFADTRDHPGGPDGACVDAEGCLWSAEYRGGRVVRYTPDGSIDTVISLPVTQATSCAFGGEALDTLYITTARQNLTPEQLAAQPLAGALFAARPGVRGLPEPRYCG